MPALPREKWVGVVDGWSEEFLHRLLICLGGVLGGVWVVDGAESRALEDIFHLSCDQDGGNVFTEVVD